MDILKPFKLEPDASIKKFQEKINTKVYDVNCRVAEEVFTTGKSEEGKFIPIFTKTNVQIALLHRQKTYIIGVVNPELESAFLQNAIVTMENFSFHKRYDRTCYVLYKIFTNRAIKRWNNIKELCAYTGLQPEQLFEYFKTSDEEELMNKSLYNITLLECVKYYAK
ncbi:MAG: hypothetical protein NZ519_10895 [Bacteroidia bacterium]|nr:hypothetical protein [Bacteroidia bacterium]MDW8302287.1 hypothetical protein [Bacteroidia bacterium]